MTPLILACDAPNLRESLQAAYAMPAPNYDQPRAVPDSGATWVMLVGVVVAIWAVRKFGNK
jgi:hypothetical protein